MTTWPPRSSLAPAEAFSPEERRRVWGGRRGLLFRGGSGLGASNVFGVPKTRPGGRLARGSPGPWGLARPPVALGGRSKARRLCDLSRLRYKPLALRVG